MKVRHILYVKYVKCTGDWKNIEDLIINYEGIIDRAEPVEPSYIVIEILNDDDNVNKLIQRLNDKNLNVRHIKRRYYTKKEIENAEYAVLYVPEPWFHRGYNAEYFGTKYSEPCCKLCNRGKKQTSNLYISTQKARHYNICGLTPELIVDEDTQNLILKNNFTGVTFAETYDYRTKKQSSFKQLIPSPLSCRMNQDSGVNLEKCEQCQEFFIEYSFDEIIYNLSDKEKFKDFNMTYESFRMTTPNGVLDPFCIVSHKVIDVFTKNKIRAVKFKPIKFI